jgi:tetratricopeptide (TPR) repeat protein
LLSVLVHFFERGRWGSPVETAAAGQSLTAEDQLFILMQAGMYLTATRGFGAPEAQICYDRAERLCHSLNRPLLLYVTLAGHWRFSLHAEKLTSTMRIAERVCTLAEEQNNPALKVGAYQFLAATLYNLGDFQAARKYARSGIQIWRSGTVLSPVDDFENAVVCCLGYDGVLDWHFGEMDSCQATMAEAIALAKEVNDMHGLAFVLCLAALVGYCKRDPAEVERLASDVIELSTRHRFTHWLVHGSILRGWARSASGNTKEGISWIEDGIRDFRATGAIIGLPTALGMKAEALHLADRTSEALEAIKEAEALVERYEERRLFPELLRLRGVFLTAMGADETQIEASFGEAIRVAKEQKSVSLEKRAEATYAEYRRQKASGLGGRGFRLPLC